VTLRLEDSPPATCPRCKRGAEACQWCENIATEDWRAICDCGLYDFGDHLFDCDARARFRYVIPADYDTAELLRDA
jgi:hypothetical protein